MMNTKINFLSKQKLLTGLFGVMILLVGGVIGSYAQGHNQRQENRAIQQHQRQEQRQYNNQERYEHRNNSGYYNKNGYYNNGQYNNPYYNQYPNGGNYNNRGYYNNGRNYPVPHRDSRNGFKRKIHHLFGGH